MPIFTGSEAFSNSPFPIFPEWYSWGLKREGWKGKELREKPLGLQSMFHQTKCCLGLLNKLHFTKCIYR